MGELAHKTEAADGLLLEVRASYSAENRKSMHQNTARPIALSTELWHAVVVALTTSLKNVIGVDRGFYVYTMLYNIQTP